MKRENLEAYLTLAGSMIGAGAMNAQVTYTDFDPDLLFDFNNAPIYFLLDIDQNGNPDLVLEGRSSSNIYNYSYTYTTYYGSTTRYFSYSRTVFRSWELEGFNANAQVASMNSFIQDVAMAFSNGDSIRDQSNIAFSQTKGKLYGYSFYQFSSNSGGGSYSYIEGEWIPFGLMQFAGIKLLKNGQPYFGWVRMTRNSVNQLTIHDMAINDNPNIAIAAGDTGSVNNVGLTELKPNLAKILRGTDKIIVQTNPRISDFKLSIFDMSGKRIYEENGKPGERKEIGTND